MRNGRYDMLPARGRVDVNKNSRMIGRAATVHPTQATSFAQGSRRRCRVFRRRRAVTTGWTWACLDHRCGYHEPPTATGVTTWAAAVEDAYAHLSWHARLHHLAA